MVERTNEVESETKVSEQAEKKIKEPNLSLSSIRHILKLQGVYKITKPALQEIQFILSDILRDMARNVIIFTKHRKAKISSKEDVLLSIR